MDRFEVNPQWLGHFTQLATECLANDHKLALTSSEGSMYIEIEPATGGSPSRYPVNEIENALREVAQSVGR